MLSTAVHRMSPPAARAAAPTRPIQHCLSQPPSPAAAPHPQVRRLSRLYESAPAYVTDQPPFLNAAALVDTSLPPLALLRRLKEVEVRLCSACRGCRVSGERAHR